MISAFAQSGLLLKNQDYIDTAKKAANFIISNLYKDNELFRSYKDNRPSHKAYLDDYAFFIAALLDLFEADPDPLWFKTAIELDKILFDLYFKRVHFLQCKRARDICRRLRRHIYRGQISHGQWNIPAA